MELDHLFYPKSVAVIGASRSPLKMGARLFSHLILGGYKGKVYPVNPKEKRILGYPAFPSVKEIPEEVDLSVITLPSSAVPSAMEECTEAKVKACVVISSGFREVGEKGKELEEEIKRIASGRLRFVGPNCQGISNTHANLHLTLTPIFAPQGKISIVSQSGTIAAVVAQSLSGRGAGCSKIVSSGNEADLRMEDYLEYLSLDKETEIICIFLEGVRDGRRFFNILSRMKKPVIIFKAASTLEGIKAAVSHTGAISLSQEVYDAAFRQSGAIKVSSVSELIDTALAFSILPPSRGRKVCIVTGGGGGGVIGADTCSSHGLKMVELSEKLISKLDSFLPEFWSRRNPVDITAAAVRDFKSYADSIEVLLSSEEIDLLILMGAIGIIGKIPSRYENLQIPESMRAWVPDEKFFFSMEEKMSSRLAEVAKKYKKPVVSINPAVSAADVDPAIGRITEILASGGITSHATPEDAIKALRNMVRWYERFPSPSKEGQAPSPRESSDREV